MLYITRFNRLDNGTEDYYYYTKEEAENHLELFRDDDSNLYKNIQIIRVEDNTEYIINTMVCKV